MTPLEKDIQVYLVRLTARYGQAIRKLHSYDDAILAASHIPIPLSKNLSTNTQVQIQRLKKEIKAFQRELNIAIEQPIYAEVYFRCLLDGSIDKDFAKMPSSKTVYCG